MFRALRTAPEALKGAPTALPLRNTTSSAAARSISSLPPTQSRPRQHSQAINSLQLQPATPRRTRHPFPVQHFRLYHNPYWHDPDGSRRARAQPLFTASSAKRIARSPNTHIIVVISIAGAFIFYFSNLETVPVTGRTRFNVYSPESVREAGEMQYKALLYELERDGARILPDYDFRSIRVKRVMRKLIPFSGMADENWEIIVIDAPKMANAFVLPGGKVFVFSGILPLARSDDALAAVLGHEIAHNVADHVGERMSQAIGTNIVLYSAMALVGFLGFGPLLMHWVGSRFLDVAFGNPMSRLQETEADFIGLMMMAEACYDPKEAVAFWARMEAAKGEEIPEWLSTHPSNVSRIKKIQEWLPQAMEKRRSSDCQSTMAFADLFRRALSQGIVII